MLKFWIDVGGTFADCLAVDQRGCEQTTKVLSSGVFPGQWPHNHSPSHLTNPKLSDFGPRFFAGYTLHLIDAQGRRIASRVVRDYDDRDGSLVFEQPFGESETSAAARYELASGEPAPILCVRRILKAPLLTPLPPLRMALGTTRGTNALLTRSGAPVGLVLTAGFGDLLEIGEQDRPKLFELTIRKPTPLAAQVLEVDERISADGTVLKMPERETVIEGLRRMREQGIRSLAVVLMHGYRFPSHELLVADWAREVGFREISISHQIAPAIKLVPRAETTVLDAYLNPVIRSYLADLRKRLGPGSQLEVMTSHGGLVAAERFSGKDSILSGPAGGVVGFARTAEQLGIRRAIGFDMGGTSTDVARYDGRFDLEYESRKAGVRVVAPVMAIETVAAGGGSICDFNGTQLTVGPASAGADPGPACYGRGGPLTMTDVNLYLGQLAEDQFPFPLDRQAVEQRLKEMCRQVAEPSGQNFAPHELAAGFREIANRNMAAAVHAVSVARGFDPATQTLVAFGGAGPQHAAQVAELLGIRQVLIHPRGSILSAVGIRLADRTVHLSRPCMRLTDADAWREVAFLHEELTRETEAELRRTWPDAQTIRTRRSVSLRYAGTEPFLNVEQPDDGDYVTQFEADHERLFGYRQQRDIEIVSARVESTIEGEGLPPLIAPATWTDAQPARFQSLWIDGQRMSVPSFDWWELQPGSLVRGPALVVDPMTTVAVESGWVAEVWADRQLLMRRGEIQVAPLSSTESGQPRAAARQFGESAGPDPIHLEIFNHRFMSIAKEMGLTLQRTAVSVNIRDRLDFSCAIFSPHGDLIVNAPHIPVHLGAMSETVRHIIEDNPDAAPGDAFITNDPFRGGSHLPDVTVVTPVFIPGHNRPSFWVASRGHHAEIGGKTPGSMPPDARFLSDEGVLIRCMKLIDQRRERFAELEQLLSLGPYPSRAVADNLSDIRAQLAANKRGLDRLLEFVAEQSLPFVTAYMQFVQDAAEQQVRAALRSIPDGDYEFTDQMDSGARIQVAIDKRGDGLIIDFSGTSPVQPDNLNANRAIVLAATMYVMRCLLATDIPLNQGVVRPVELRLPDCFLNPPPCDDPRLAPAVVGGNVETSQRVVDCLLGALGLAAASQGTMNNWLMGDDRFGYYETLGGGSGATPVGPGAHAVHTHMSNTRLTDPEVTETRYPVLVHRLAIRRGSGGAGRHRGGDGMVREIEFLAPMTLSLLTSRRTTAPYGLAGGHPGAPGLNTLLRADGTHQLLPFRVQLAIQPGERLIIETPGGGGWGG